MDKALMQSEADLVGLVGQAESIRLEFKQSALLQQPREKFIEHLSKEISAFANTEGGQLVIGIREERKGKSRYAAELDEGIDPSAFTAESLQQAVEASISPYLPGIRFIRVPLTTSRPGRVAVVIAVPRGLTAYQANDRRYYGRSEFEVRPLPDHEIRLRMLRPRIAVVQVEPQPINRINFGDVDHYTFHTVIHNVGELTIRTCILSLEFQREPTCPLGEHTSAAIATGTEVHVPFEGDDVDHRIYPGDSLDYPGEPWRVILPHDRAFADTALQCRWKVYLDDAPPSSGTM